MPLELHTCVGTAYPRAHTHAHAHTHLLRVESGSMRPGYAPGTPVRVKGLHPWKKTHSTASQRPAHRPAAAVDFRLRPSVSDVRCSTGWPAPSWSWPAAPLRQSALPEQCRTTTSLHAHVTHVHLSRPSEVLRPWCSTLESRTAKPLAIGRSLAAMNGHKGCSATIWFRKSVRGELEMENCNAEIESLQI